MKDEVLKIIDQSKWTVIKDQDNIKMIQVQSGKKKANIYWGTMTVVWCYANGGQATYKNVDLYDLESMLGIDTGTISNAHARFGLAYDELKNSFIQMVKEDTKKLRNRMLGIKK